MTDKIKFTMCGCGHIAPRWLKVFQENSDIKFVAIADPDPDALEKLKNYNFPELKFFEYIERREWLLAPVLCLKHINT